MFGRRRNGGGRDRAASDGAERDRWGLSEVAECRGGWKWAAASGTGLAGREMKGRDRNSDRRASDVPQAGREGEMRQEVEES